MEPLTYQFADPQAAIMNGLKTGAFLSQVDQQRQQQQLAQQAAIQQQTDLRTLSMNPNAGASDYAAMMTRYPGLAENLGKAFKVMDEGQQKNLLNFQSRVYAAQQSGNNELAVELLRERAKADPAGAQHYTTMADLIEKSPATARTITALSLASAMGPDKFAESFAKIGGEQRAEELQGDLVRKGRADADKAGSEATIKGEEAKVAAKSVMLDLEKKGWDIKKLQADTSLANETKRLRAMEVALAKETNPLKVKELQQKLAEGDQKIAESVRAKVATAEAGATNIDNMLNTIERIKKNKSLNSVLGSLEGKPYYPNAALGTLNPMGDGDERADAIRLIETLGSQAFLAQIPNIKGTGALSNAEGEKLQAALQNLSREQSEKQFRENLDEAARLLNKGRVNLSRSTGVPLAKPDTPAAPGARPPLSSFQK